MIKQYLIYRRALILLYLAVMILFPGVQVICRVTLSPVLSVMQIITFFMVIFWIGDFLRFRGRHRQLEQIARQLSVQPHEFPQPRNLCEADDFMVIQGLYDKLRDSLQAVDEHHAEQEEVYTLWVHQIKTPIAALQLLEQSDLPFDDKARGLLRQELFKIEQYVEMALQYIKMEDLSTDLVVREYSLQEIVRASVKKYAPLFIYKKLTIEIEDFDTVVLTDSKWLSFIIEQLLSNAIKYTYAGGVSISCKKKMNGRPAELHIRDTGIGIKREDLQRVFEKGYTGYNGRVDKKASGIGLYLARKVAREMAHEVYLDSIVSEGTLAVVRFPLHDKADYE